MSASGDAVLARREMEAMGTVHTRYEILEAVRAADSKAALRPYVSIERPEYCQSRVAKPTKVIDQYHS